jgi:RNA polymerase sigma-70 factor, ECF subfamily
MHEEAPPREQVIQEACARADYEAAATQILDAFGAELLGFLRARMRADSDGDEVFSMVAEDLWRGLPNFAFRSSVRTWLYTLARNAALRYARSPSNRAARRHSLTQHPSVEALVDRTRSATQLHKQTETKDRLRALCETLPEDDQTLLILHLDRKLPWRDLALVMRDGGPPLTEEALVREAARLRKRYERIKELLRERARCEGLIPR